MSASEPGSLPVDVASRVQLPPGPWTLLIDGLCARFPGVDAVQWQSRLARGRVLDAQGRALHEASPYVAGMVVQYFREVLREPAIPFEAAILHADEDLVVADKPHFLPVAPTGAWVEQTLLRRLMRALDNPALVPLHRLDRLTAGLVMFSARPASRAAYHALFRTQTISKRYEALAPALPHRRFPLVRESRIEVGEPFFRRREVDGTPNSRTRIDVLERGSRSWRYALEPMTGRTHQLRLHLAALAAPIDNDPLYPQLKPTFEQDDFEHPLKLLASELRFNDPLTGETRHFRTRFRL